MASIALPAKAPGPHCVLDDVVVYTELAEDERREGMIAGSMQAWSTGFVMPKMITVSSARMHCLSYT